MKFDNFPLIGLDNCPRCGVRNPLFSPVGEVHRAEWVGDHRDNKCSRLTMTYQCSKCAENIYVEGVIRPTDSRGNFDTSREALTVDTIFPLPITVADELPAEAKRFLKQAIETKFAPDASIVMAACAVDAMLKDKGLLNGSLFSRINKAVEDHLITEDMSKWAHSVRLEANSSRHVDETTSPPTLEDAERLIDFASALGDFMYVFADRVDRGLKSTNQNS